MQCNEVDKEFISDTTATKNSTKPKIENELQSATVITNNLVAQKIDKNLQVYTEKMLTLSNKINIELSKNQNLNLDLNTLALAKTEDNIKNIFKKAGMVNYELVFTMLKETVDIQNNFRTSTPEYYKLSQNERQTALDKNKKLIIDNAVQKTNQPIVAQLAGGRLVSECWNSYSISYDRCREDLGDCSVKAIIAAGVGGYVPGLIGATYCGYDYYKCDDRAKIDYAICLKKPILTNPDEFVPRPPSDKPSGKPIKDKK